MTDYPLGVACQLIMVRPEGFEPPAFWSVACLRDGVGFFQPCLALFVQPVEPLIYHLFH